MRRLIEHWRFLGAAIAAALLGASQLEPNPLPAWVFPVVAVLVLITVGASLLADWRARH